MGKALEVGFSECSPAPALRVALQQVQQARVPKQPEKQAVQGPASYFRGFPQGYKFIRVAKETQVPLLLVLGLWLL